MKQHKHKSCSAGHLDSNPAKQADGPRILHRTATSPACFHSSLNRLFPFHHARPISSPACPPQMHAHQNEPSCACVVFTQTPPSSPLHSYSFARKEPRCPRSSGRAAIAARRGPHAEGDKRPTALVPHHNNHVSLIFFPLAHDSIASRFSSRARIAAARRQWPFQRLPRPNYLASPLSIARQGISPRCLPRWCMHRIDAESFSPMVPRLTCSLRLALARMWWVAMTRPVHSHQRSPAARPYPGQTLALVPTTNTTAASSFQPKPHEREPCLSALPQIRNKRWKGGRRRRGIAGREETPGR